MIQKVTIKVKCDGILYLCFVTFRSMERELFETKLPPVDVRTPKMSLFEYYSRSTDPDIKGKREYWNSVFAHCRLGEKNKKVIRTGITSKYNWQHLSTIFELFTYQFFKDLGYRLRGHPKIGPKELDFKLLSPTRGNCYVECTCLIGEVDKRTIEVLKHIIRKTLKERVPPRFRIYYDIEGIKPHYNLVERSFAHSFRCWLSDLAIPFDSHVEKGREATHDGIKRTFTFDGITVRIEFNPSAYTSDTQAYPMILDPTESGRVRIGEHLQDKIAEKMKQGRRARLPFLVAVNVIEDRLNDEEILRALYGVLLYSVRFAKKERVLTSVVRKGEGALQYKGEIHHRHLTGLLIFDRVDFHSVQAKKPRLILNPFARNRDFPMDIPQIEYFKPSEDRFSLKPL